MSQCLRCGKPCASTAVFCNECRSLLRNQLHQGSTPHAQKFDTPAFPGKEESEIEIPAPASTEHDLGDLLQPDGDQNSSNSAPNHLYERITDPQPIVSTPLTPALEEAPALAFASYTNIAEQTISRLNEAAQLIAAEEAKADKSDHKNRFSYPRASHLAPIRDISADIRRESTPLPQVGGVPQSEPGSENGVSGGAGGTTPEERRVQIYRTQTANGHSVNDGKDANGIDSASPAEKGLASEMPDLWPWLDTESEDKEIDNWANQTDPLLARRFPNSVESARIEEEDIRRAVAEGLATAPVPTNRNRLTSLRASPLRMIFIALVILGVVALAVDGILLSVAFVHPHQTDNPQSGPPTLTLSQNVVRVWQSVKVNINHFTPSTTVLLTHDIQEQVQTESGSSLVTIGSNGTASVSIIIDDGWGPGFHLLVAEDVTTRYTASATLQVVGAGQSLPPHLVIGITSLGFGADIEGINTIKSLLLHNSGDGSITWSASSNSSWLLVSPAQGMFSKSQDISVAVQRAGLKPKDYKGTITFFSNVGAAQTIQVEMTVLRLPPGVGPVLSLVPAVLSFTTIDGDTQTSSHILTVSNPGTQTLSWSLTISATANQTIQKSLLHMLGSKGNWLSTDLTTGIVAPGAAENINVIVQSQNLLPGAYIGTLLFSGHGAYDSSQTVNVALTVQPHCGLVLNPGNLSFISVQGQGNPTNQTLNLSATSSCNGATINWRALPGAPWLNVTPNNGQVKGTSNSVASVGVNVSSLAPGVYNGVVAFTAGESTQTVMVQLTVQPAPGPGAPIMAASPLSLNFSNTQGQPSPPGQDVAITNNGGSLLKWSTSVNQLSSIWLYASPSGGNVPPGQSGQMRVNVDTSTLTPGNYVGQITLNGRDSNGHDAGGSPQTVTVNLVVQPPCSLTQPSSGSLAFNGDQGGLPPIAQAVTFTGTGSCVWPLSWNTTVNPAVSWLMLTPTTGTIKGGGQTSSIGVAVSIGKLGPGTYSTNVSISATDGNGTQAQGSPQKFSVTLTVLQPCTLQTTPLSLAFSAVQGQPSPAAQSFTLNETGDCARPISWTATGDPGSSAWLVISPTSGSDSGSGSTVSVSVNATNQVPNVYTGQITVAAKDNYGVVIHGSSQTITVTLTVTGYTISGTIIACPGPPPNCTLSAPLPGATLTLLNNGNTIATVVADAAGNYIFTNVPVGSYTINVAGIDGNNVHYVGSTTIAVINANITGFIIDVFPG